MNEERKPERKSLCAHEDCQKEGAYPAPRNCGKNRGYVYFCLEHVRAYNAKWDCLASFSEKEIERFIRESTVWERPTWAFGKGPLFSKEKGEGKKPEKPREIRAALRLLGLEETASFADVKARHRTLAKKLHPDARGGNVSEVEKFHRLQQAFGTLRCYYAQGAQTKKKTAIKRKT